MWGFFVFVRLRDDIAKEMGFVERKLSNYTGNQWREFFRMLPSTAESLLREIAAFMPDAENHEDMRNICGNCLFCPRIWLEVCASHAGVGVFQA